MFLSVDESVNNVSIRRKNFYLRNGFYDTNRFYEDTGVNYEVLCTNDKYEITDDIMKMRYTNMTNNHKLFEIIYQHLSGSHLPFFLSHSWPISYA